MAFWKVSSLLFKLLQINGNTAADDATWIICFGSKENGKDKSKMFWKDFLSP